MPIASGYTFLENHFIISNFCFVGKGGSNVESTVGMPTTFSSNIYSLFSLESIILCRNFSIKFHSFFPYYQQVQALKKIKDLLLFSPIISLIVPASVPNLPYHILFTRGDNDSRSDIVNYKFTSYDVICFVISLCMGAWYLLKKVSLVFVNDFYITRLANSLLITIDLIFYKVEILHQ